MNTIRSFCWLMLFLMNPLDSTYAQTTPFPELELITMENVARLVKLPGELNDVNNGFDVSPDGKQIAVDRPDGVYLYDMGSFETPAAIFEIPDADDVYGPRFSPDGKLLTINVIYQLSEGFTPENFKSTTQLWNMEQAIKADEIVLWLALGQQAVFSPDGHYLVGNSSLHQTTKSPNAESGSSLHIWSLNDSLQIEPLCCPERDLYGRYGIRDVEFSPDNLVLLWSIIEPDFMNSGYSINNFWRIEYLPSRLDMDSDVGILTPLINDLARRNQTFPSDEPFTVDVIDIEFSRDGVLLATNGEYSKIWQIETVELKTTLPEGNKFSAFLSDNSLLTIDENNGTLYVTDLDLSKKFIIFEDYDALQQTPFLSSDGKLLTLYQNGIVNFYSVPTKSE